MSHESKQKGIKGQSLLEVAVFGSIIIMLLGILISYGLRYNYQQRLMQQAFRKSLADSVLSMTPGAPVSVSNAVVTDKHIPNPADTFGVGTVTPFIGSAGGVTRNYKLAETPDLDSELPRIVININGQDYTYKTAGFREEYNVPVLFTETQPQGSLGRYGEIYGNGNFWETGDGVCLEEGVTVDPNTGENTSNCLQPTKNIKIIDSCAGEIVDYGSAVRQCRMIVDSDACAKECSRASDPATCSSICSQPINVPWYCETKECGLNECKPPKGVNHIYNFVKLNQLFSFSGLKAMGLQQDYEQHTATNNTLKKAEDASGITTTDNLDWNVQTKHKIIYRNGEDTTPNIQPAKEVTTDVGQKEDKPSTTTNW